MKQCSCCNEIKPLTEFSKSNRKARTKGNFARAYVEPDGYYNECKQCKALKSREFRQRYKEVHGTTNYKGTGKIKKIPKEDRLLMSAIRKRVTEAKLNNKRHPDRPFTITAEYMYELWKAQNGLCALTNYPIEIEGNSNLKLSIDKIVPELGYTIGNVQWTLFSANRAKGDMSYQDLISLCRMIIERATTIENTEKSGSE